ncbi:lipoprotein [Streptomyces spiralis]|uniref:Lipoprotein n=1 Tax=Streptomyces spiralis TaxID=66376 RepID=A0A919DLD9_9ACTN|nr:hypothetical protein [Streptomyces spiralis]GHE54080.1 lipoprotein [Streptomyces spiralis]
MRTTVVRRTALVASAAALALFATACGGSSDGGDKGSDGKTAQADKTASAAPAAAKPLTAAELEKAALTQADVKSGKVVEKVPASDNVVQEKVTTDKAACAPLAYLQAGSYVGKPSATAKREWRGAPKRPAAGASDEEKLYAGMDAPQVLVTLASYENGGAEQAMKDIDAAVTACADGFSFAVGGEKTKNLKVTKTDTPQGADQAFALTTLVEFEEGVKAPVKGVVVRKGATLAYFPAVNIGAAAAGKDFPFPTDIVDAQLAKLN